ncbi:MAG: cytochrome c oxidase subunit II [Candidatus Thalassarchaeaceae archaeon]|jgi:cytochrome c oxidase subunit 2|nr:cytochrome c oxidase subunit II [Candidatus Thalassarchaeaceae archaeon]MDP6844316.1 cytochrome c oxidase subunit II [Candidatus Thalassarchaeaceae archaeon]HJL58786.1 cytochrome c oxidase subunit II [Candidatus Thalassarchaeaceae archaeon]
MINRRYMAALFFGVLLLLSTFAGIFNWFQGLGGTGEHADVYDKLFTLYWGLGSAITLGIFLWFFWMLSTTQDEEPGDVAKLGVIPIERGDKKVAYAISIVITLFLLLLSSVTFDSIDFFEKHEQYETDESFTIKVTGYQYYWKYQYPNGIEYTSVENEPLRIPVDVPIVFEVTSGDVFHSFALPEHRIKIDALPSRANTGWIHAEETGLYPVRCFELCGDDHAIMMGELLVMEKVEFDTWYSGEVDA